MHVGAHGLRPPAGQGGRGLRRGQGDGGHLGRLPLDPPRDKRGFTREDALKAADAFNKIGKAAREAGLGFGYHCHGYEFVPATEGTLFDTLAQAADPTTVTFQIDVFHAHHGGADVPKLIEKHKGRVTSLHLKDVKKGEKIVPGTPGAGPEVDVPVGTGQVDYPAVLRAAVAAGTSKYFVEDESKDPLAHIPLSIAFLGPKISCCWRDEKSIVYSVNSLSSAHLFPTSASNCRRSSSDIG